MPKFEDNLSPYLTLVEQGSTPASPAAGNRKAYVRTSDHSLVAVDSTGTVVALGGGSGTGPYEYDYAEVTGGGGAVTLAGTSAATATTVVAGHAVTYDGATAVVIEVHAERWQKGTTFSILDLWEDSTNIARIATTTIADSGPVSTAFRRTPSAGSHTYTVKGYSDGGTGSVYAGAAGVDVSMPVFLRVTAATASGAIATSLAHGYDSVATDESTTSASYTDLATAGPSVTVTVNTKAKVTLSADMYGSLNGCICRMAVDMSGANTHAASDVDNLLYCNFDGTNNEHAASRVLYFSGLTPGSTTFKAKYKRSVGGTAHWFNRTILVERMD